MRHEAHLTEDGDVTYSVEINEALLALYQAWLEVVPNAPAAAVLAMYDDATSTSQIIKVDEPPT